jgi:hypothetical protein
MGNKNILFVGLERTDNCMIYDVTNQTHRLFTNAKKQNAPEGLLYSLHQSPTKEV